MTSHSNQIKCLENLHFSSNVFFFFVFALTHSRRVWLCVSLRMSHKKNAQRRMKKLREQMIRIEIISWIICSPAEIRREKANCDRCVRSIVRKTRGFVEKYMRLSWTHKQRYFRLRESHEPTTTSLRHGEKSRSFRFCNHHYGLADFLQFLSSFIIRSKLFLNLKILFTSIMFYNFFFLSLLFKYYCQTKMPGG